jgi:hypothetical protein
MSHSPRDTIPADEPHRSTTVALARLHARAWGIATGLLCGATLAVATVILVLKGGATVGQHLGLLSAFLPGYSVTLTGAVIGFVYLFVIGYALGRLTGTLYNAFARDE